MGSSRAGRLHQNAVRLRRWLPTLELVSTLGTISDYDAFLEQQVAKVANGHVKGKDRRALRDQLDGLLRQHLTAHGQSRTVDRGPFTRLLQSARDAVAAHGFDRTAAKPLRITSMPAPQTLTSVESASGEPAMTSSPAPAPVPPATMVTQRFRFPVKPDEARAILVHLTVKGSNPARLVETIVRGRGLLGHKLWSVLTEGGYVVPEGKHGMDTPAHVDGDKFMQTRFVLAPAGKKQFKGEHKRPYELPESERTDVEPLKFIASLLRIAKGQEEETRTPAPVAPTPAPAAARRAPTPAPVPTTTASMPEPGAFDAHLARLAQEVAQLRTERVRKATELGDAHALVARLAQELGDLEGRHDALAEELIVLTNLRHSRTP